jgi:hypothetical protein
MAVTDEDDVDDGEDELDAAPAVSPMSEMVGQLMKLLPVAIAAFSGGKMPALAEIVDWRKAAAASDVAKAPKKAIAASTSPAPEAPAASSGGSVDLSQITPMQMAHFIAIQAALTPDEAAIAREVAAGLSDEERRTWLDELTALSVPDAVAKIRALIGGKEKVS